jgi:hypothetical protein
VCFLARTVALHLLRVCCLLQEVESRRQHNGCRCCVCIGQQHSGQTLPLGAQRCLTQQPAPATGAVMLHVFVSRCGLVMHLDLHHACCSRAKLSWSALGHRVVGGARKCVQPCATDLCCNQCACLSGIVLYACCNSAGHKPVWLQLKGTAAPACGRK